MHIILFKHPEFLNSQSMPRFARMLADGMVARGHTVEEWSPKPKFYRLPVPGPFKKWMGYIDQYLLFPRQVKKKIKQKSADTIFVFADQALGPWVPMVAHMPHAIHCHDFLAQRSALGNIAENPVSFTGKKYQAYIRNGYSKGKYFISVSKKTQADLHQLLGFKPKISEVVYNGLNPVYTPSDKVSIRVKLAQQTGIELKAGYILHVGGNQWYKNRTGVLTIYDQWRHNTNKTLPLLLIGAQPNEQLKAIYEDSDYKKDIHFLTGKDDSFVKDAYGGASVFIFPSLDEGFGWPIAEAMASGTVVMTTDNAPMNEVGGNVALYIPRRELNYTYEWSKNAANGLDKALSLSQEENNEIILKALEHVKRFNLNSSLDSIEAIYHNILSTY